MEDYSLYYPDVFSFKTTFKDEKLDLRANYDSINGVSTANVKGYLLQSLLLYDSIFIHAWEIPVVIHFFNGRNNAERIAQEGLIKIVNSEDRFIGCSKNRNSYTLAGGEFRRGTFSSADDINNMLQSFRGNYNDYKEISDMLLKSSINLKTNDFYEKVENEITKDISDINFREKYRLTTTELHSIYPQDVVFLNSRLEVYKRIYYAQSLNAKNVFAEDTLINTIKEKVDVSSALSGINIDINEEFSKLTKVLKIPNIVEAVENGLLTTKDVLEIRQKKNCIEFRKWLHSHAYIGLSEKDNGDVIAAYIDSLNQKGLLEKWPSRLIRFVVTSAIGMIPGVNIGVSTGIAAIDSFLLDKFKIGRWKPDFFINDYKKYIKNA